MQKGFVTSTGMDLCKYEVKEGDACVKPQRRRDVKKTTKKYVPPIAACPGKHTSTETNDSNLYTSKHQYVQTLTEKAQRRKENHKEICASYRSLSRKAYIDRNQRLQPPYVQTSIRPNINRKGAETQSKPTKKYVFLSQPVQESIHLQPPYVIHQYINRKGAETQSKPQRKTLPPIVACLGEHTSPTSIRPNINTSIYQPQRRRDAKKTHKEICVSYRSLSRKAYISNLHTSKHQYVQTSIRPNINRKGAETQRKPQRNMCLLSQPVHQGLILNKSTTHERQYINTSIHLYGVCDYLLIFVGL